MRYYFRTRTLVLRGTFRAAGTGNPGGLDDVPTILFQAGGEPADRDDSPRRLESVLRREGLPQKYFGILTGGVRAENICIMQYDYLTLFLDAGATQGDGGSPVPVSMVVISREGMTDAALLEAIMTVTAAREEALRSAGRRSGGSPLDGVIVACEGKVQHQSAGSASEIGMRLRESVSFGVAEALARQEGRAKRDVPSFFIYSRYQGGHWVEWVPKDCPYYPCHFPGQRCDFCYCPFYPCGDEALGQWVASASRNGEVWNCSGCTLLHEPEIADYLIAHPEAPLAELKRKKGRPR
ncbi:MAG TPA: cysteine-rich small domain-containing protein [Methanolinea sp.]|nr:cysteine-rich small domain-containing protein [Methanolinea sp.]HQK56435.1 cysteine-rich small domain-containing protein [Methanolinea sp.]